MADDFASKFAHGIDTMHHQGGSMPAPTPKQQSAWMAVKGFFQNPEGDVEAQPVPSQATPNVDPYQNAASVLSGKGRIAP